MSSSGVTGLTKDAGWEFGIRRTFPLTAEEAWSFLLSKKATDIWLGKVRGMEWEAGKVFKTANGIEGKITIFTPLSHMRMKWKRKSDDHFSMLQPRIIKGVRRTVISFHHDKLASAGQRLEMKEYWNEILDKLENLIKK